MRADEVVGQRVAAVPAQVGQVLVLIVEDRVEQARQVALGVPGFAARGAQPAERFELVVERRQSIEEWNDARGGLFPGSRVGERKGQAAVAQRDDAVNELPNQAAALVAPRRP